MDSDNNKKSSRIVKNTIVLYFRMLFLMAISLYTGRVVLDVLGIDDYGIYNVVGGFVAMFALVSSSLTGANMRFLNYEMGLGNQERIKNVFSSLLTVQSLLALIIFILCEIIGNWYINNMMVLPAERMSSAIWCLHFSLLSFCIDLISVPYRAAIVAHERMKAFAYVSIFEGLAKLGICFLIMIAPFDRLFLYAALLFVVQSIVRLAYQIYCKINFKECHYKFVFDKVLLKELFAYSGWHIVGNSANILKNHGTSIVLNFFFGPVVNAAKGVANQVMHAILGFTNNFMLAMNPQITQSYAKQDYKYMLYLVHKGSRFSFYILFLISLPLLVNADWILSIWLKEVPQNAVIFTQLSIIIAIITSLSNTLITAQNATGKVRNYQLVVGGIQLLNLPLAVLFLYLNFSPSSVLIIAIILEIIALFSRMIMLHPIIKDFSVLQYTKDVILNCFCVAAASCILPLLKEILWQSHSTSSVIINITLCIFGSSVSVLFIGCNKSERQSIFQKIPKLKAKFVG